MLESGTSLQILRAGGILILSNITRSAIEGKEIGRDRFIAGKRYF